MTRRRAATIILAVVACLATYETGHKHGWDACCALAAEKIRNSPLW